VLTATPPAALRAAAPDAAGALTPGGNCARASLKPDKERMISRPGFPPAPNRSTSPTHQTMRKEVVDL
jgi:hypothetical protein